MAARVEWFEDALAALLTSVGSPVAVDLRTKGEIGAEAARRLAPTSADGSHGRPAGYLRSQISSGLAQDGEGLYVDITSAAATPSGAPYSLFVEVGTSKMDARPYLRPSLNALREGGGGSGGGGKPRRSRAKPKTARAPKPKAPRASRAQAKVAYTDYRGRVKMVTAKQAANYARLKKG